MVLLACNDGAKTDKKDGDTNKTGAIIADSVKNARTAETIISDDSIGHQMAKKDSAKLWSIVDSLFKFKIPQAPMR